MSITPLNLARVSNLQWGAQAQQQLDATQTELLQSQNELSTGKQINVPSDNPGNAAIILNLQKTLDQQKTYTNNLNSANTQLSEVDNQLGSLTTLVQQAQQIASADVGSSTSADARASDAEVVQSLYNQALGIANTQFGGGYLFGGDKNTTAPFVSTTGGVQFVGSTTTLTNAADANALLPFQISAQNVFGALSSQVQGSVDLTPTANVATRIIALNGTGGDGVHLGTIQVGNGSTTALVDLSHADNLGDVINAINAAGVGNITASISASGNGITLSTTGADNITVQDVGGGSTAADLGIARATGTGAGNSLVGGNVGPKVTPFTGLSNVRDGAGIDQTHGLVITNGSKSVTIDTSHASNVEDLLNAINGSGIGAQATINAAGNGINIVNTIQGTNLTVGENGGTTASDLGVRSLAGGTPLSQLNNGKGVSTVAGGDFAITRTDGTSFNVSLSNAKTIQDVISAINLASGGSATTGVGVTASLAASGNGIVLTDTAAGAGTLGVSPLNSSQAAADLGLNVPASSGGTVINGADTNPVGTTGLFSDLASLRDALRSNDQKAITAAGGALQADYTKVVDARGTNGASLKEIQSRQSQIQDQSTATTSFLSTLQDVDYTQAVTKFQTLQTSLQAALESTAKVLNLSLLNYLG